MELFKKLKDIWQSLTEADCSATLSQEIIDAIDNLADEKQLTDSERIEMKYRQLRIRDEANMALTYPFRRLRDKGTPPTAIMWENMLETCYVLPKESIKNAYLVEKQQGDLVALPYIDIANERLFSRFQIPEQEQTISKIAAFAVEFVKTEGGKRNMVGVIQAQGMKHNQGDSYVGLKVSTLRQNVFRNYDAEALQFAFETAADGKLVRELSQTRLNAMSKDMEGLPLNVDEKASLGYYDEKDLFDAAVNLLPDHKRHFDGVEMLQKNYQKLSQRMMRDELDMQGRQLFYSVTHKLGEVYFHKGLYSKALYYLQQSRYEGATSLATDAELWEECQLRNGDLLKISEKQPQDLLGEWSTMGVTRMSIMSNACLGLGAEDLDHLLIVPNGDISQSKTINGSANILELDLLDLARKHKSYIGYLSYGGDRIAVMTAETQGDSLVIDWIVPHSAESGILEPATITFRFTMRPLVDIAQFKSLRDEASRKAIDNEELSTEEFATLGKCESAHFNFMRACQAFDCNCFGDTLYYLLKAYDRLTTLAAKQILDHFDLNALLNICYKLGFILADFKQYDMALSFLYKLKGDPQSGDIIESINCLCNANDFRAYPIILREMHKLEEKYLQDGKRSMDMNMYSFLRRRLCYVLINKGRISEARRRLYILANDPNPENRQFARQELDLLEIKYPTPTSAI